MKTVDNISAYIYKKYPIFCKDQNIKEFSWANKNKQDSEGSFGRAYYIGNNRVLKVTTDMTEANTSDYISRKNLKYTWSIYYVCQFVGFALVLQSEMGCDFREAEAYMDDNAYGIIGERLYPLSADESYVVDTFSNMFIDGTKTDGLGTMSYDDFKEEMEDFHYEYIQENPKVYDFFYYGYKELLEAGVEFRDGHSGNIMKNAEGDFKFIDLGVSKSTGGQVKNFVKEQIGRLK